MDKLSVRQLNSVVESYCHNTEYQNDKDMTLIVARRQPSMLAYADKSMLIDEEIAVEAVKTDGQALRFFEENIRGNEKIVLLAVENFCKSFAFAVGNARKNLQIAQSVARRGGETIALLDEEFLNDVTVATIAVERNPRALGYFSENVRATETLALYAITKDRTAIEFVADEAFKNKKIFEKAVLDYNGRIKIGGLNNLTPQGVFDEIERRNLRFNVAAQNLELLTLDRDKLAVCLKFGDGVIAKKADLLRRFVIAEDKEMITLIIDKGGISKKTLSDEVKFASQNKKIRVLPLLLKYTGGAGAQSAKLKDDRMYEMRSLRRKSPVAVQRFKENYQSYLQDVEMVMLAAYADGSIIKTLANTEFIKDDKFVTECLKSYIVKNSDGALLDGLDVNLTYEQAELACSRDGRNFFFLTEEYQKSINLAAIAVRSCEEVYDKLSEELQKEPSVIKEKRLWIK